MLAAAVIAAALFLVVIVGLALRQLARGRRAERLSDELVVRPLRPHGNVSVRKPDLDEYSGFNRGGDE